MSGGNSVPSDSGFVLVAAILLLVFASTIVLSVTVLVVSRLDLTAAHAAREDALQLAEGGIHSAAYSQRTLGYTPLGNNPLVTNRRYLLGAEDAGLLMVDTSTATMTGPGAGGGGGQASLNNLQIRNGTNSRTITIDRMIVNWDTGANLRRIRINGSNVWNGNASSPVDADITNFTLNTVPTTYAINQIRFQGSMLGANVSVQFVMTDTTTRTVSVFPASNNFNVVVRSTGERTDNGYWRTVQAEYNSLTGNIVDVEEIAVKIVP